MDDRATITAPDASFRFAPDELADATGWTLKPEGLCRADVCVPVRDRDALVVDGRIDLHEMARLLRRPLATDDDTALAVLGASADDRTAERAAMWVGDLEATDLDGAHVAWRSFGRKKKLLVAWASW